ncbi:hypothetical protein [Virgibacillus oceani]|uniref:Uncharacterized protein n=1 Tax=Virgibacillus oceani TaxID=1479511 RepID=A0A917LWE9_9BACI|nr:hypothetical protein [Virgibacillus oceani]GGG61273.1 hypothetical protein GCM10011398_00700 [Virgibacillus oceani]
MERIRFKGNVKRAGQKLNFWGEHEKNIPKEIKNEVYKQYFSNDTLYVYCDASLKMGIGEMSAACSYICNGNIIVENQLIYPARECYDNNMFCEIKAVVFALNNFKKYLQRSCKNVIIFSDLKDIQKYLKRELSFRRNTFLQKLQIDMIRLYKEKEMNNTDVSISVKYLEQKKHNPFAKSAHNAARKILNK